MNSRLGTSARLAWSVLLGLGVTVALAPLPQTQAQEEIEIPFLSGRVVDQAALISPEAEAQLTQRLQVLEQATGAQVAVLTVASLRNNPIEDFSHRVASQWALGGKDADGGLLFLIARDERRMRLEVGYGLEPTVTDIASKRILDDVVQPRFRQGDFDGGVKAGVTAIAGLIEGDPDALPPESSPKGAVRGRGSLMLIFFFLMFIFGPSINAVFASAPRAFVSYGFLALFWFALPFLIAGLGAASVVAVSWLVGFPLVWAVLHLTPLGQAYLKNRQARPSRRSGGRMGRGGFGGFGGGGFSGGGFSGGGFSGGGGSFGGGGASSSW